MRYPAIQHVPEPDPSRANRDEAIKATLEGITGQAPGAPQLEELGSTATLADVIATVNLIIRRLDGQ